MGNIIERKPENMHQLHFVADFSYQPSAQEPLKLFELGDAFTAGWVTTPIGTPKKQVGQYFFEDLKMQYPNALLLQAFPSGLNLIDLSDGKHLLTYDRDYLYNSLVSDQVSLLLVNAELNKEYYSNRTKTFRNCSPTVDFYQSHYGHAS